MPNARQLDIIEIALNALIDQLPTMQVRAVTLSPPDPVAGDSVVARIDVAGRRHVLCEITADGRLQAARVIES